MRRMLPKANQQRKSLRLLFFETVFKKAVTLTQVAVQTAGAEHRADEQVDSRVLKINRITGQGTDHSGQIQHLNRSQERQINIVKGRGTKKPPVNPETKAVRTRQETRRTERAQDRAVKPRGQEQDVLVQSANHQAGHQFEAVVAA